MASIIPRDQKLRKPFSKPMMLKDYLRDDLSSCSSNGFKSLPRRQCCTTVRFLLEVDLKAAGSKSTITKRLLYRSRSSKAASTTISALQRASEAVINAVKQLPFRSGKSSSSPSVQNRVRKGLLTRTLSRKLFRKSSFWRKAADDDHNKEETDVQRWRLFREILEEQDKPSDQNTHNSTTIIVPTRVSTSARSNSNSWAESEFTSVILRSSSGNSESLSENDVVEGKKKLPEKKVSKRVGVTAGEDSILGAATTYCGDNTKEWPNEEKEQFSPVSVLDCPFEDYDEEVSSPFQGNLALVEGTKQKVMHKIRRFDCLAQLEPVDLEKRIVLSEFDHEAADLQSPMQPCSMSDNDNDNKEGNQTQQKAQELLDLVKTKGSPNGFKFKADRLLSDFFRERIEEKNENGTTGCNEYCEDELLKVAEDWITGNQQELLLGWEVEEGRKIYVRDMEKGRRWSILVEEKEEVALEVEVEVWTSLLNELLLDLF